MSGALAERDFVAKMERVGFDDIEIVEREPVGVDFLARYPLFTEDLIELMRSLLPLAKQDQVAMSIVVKARLGRPRAGASIEGNDAS